MLYAQVLQPGASVAVLDFNNNPNPLIDGFQEFALANAVVPLARSFGVAEDYEYLRPSIKRFPSGELPGPALLLFFAGSYTGWIFRRRPGCREQETVQRSRSPVCHQKHPHFQRSVAACTGDGFVKENCVQLATDIFSSAISAL